MSRTLSSHAQQRLQPALSQLDASHSADRHGIWTPGVRLFRNVRFSIKAIIISLSFMVPMLALISWQLTNEFGSTIQSRQDSTRQNVEIAHGILTWAHAQEVSGVLSRKEAQKMAINTISTLRYDDKEYFWLNDMHPRIIMHPFQPELDGKDVSTLKDHNGIAVFSAFANKVREAGKGFVHYQWPKPDSTVALDKISYVQGFTPWGWVIGSGIYIDDLHAAFAFKRTVAIIGVILTLLIAGYLFLSFYRVLNGSFTQTRQHLRAMTSGNLATSPTPWGKDEAAELMMDLLAMQEALRAMVRSVRASSDEITHSTSEIASGTLDLSRRTEETANNLEKAASSMEEISATVNQSTQHTQEAAQMASHNAEVAAAGGRAMRDIVTTMEDIRSSSSQISDIISTIDSIAFQTNILALNAAVEAARAGDQGRGFAVVASEVRSLAGRSAAAAKEIKTLIDNSVEQVASGANIVRKAGSTIEEIVDTSQRVNQLLSEVALSAKEQNLGVTQIGQVIQELDRMTQQNAALVEETAAAATAMQSQAHTLTQEVALFTIPEHPTALMELQAAQQLLAAPENFDFDKAIDAHRQWKVRLRSAISKQETLDAHTISCDDKCPLGQWIHGAGGKRWSQRALFTALRNKHADFHTSAGQVAQKINAGQYADAEKLIGSGSHFSDISLEVTTLLSSAKKGI